MIRGFVRDKVILRNKMVRDIPTCINIELTNRCNLSCKMCPHSSMSNFGDMDFEIFKKIIDQVSGFADKNTSFMLVGLGEPLLYPRLNEAIEYIKSNCPESRISFATNGTLMDWSRFIVLSQLLNEKDGILVSLNTNNKEEYEKLMGADKYDMVVTNIKCFLNLWDRTVPLTVQFLDTRNGEGAKQFKEYWKPYLTSKDRIYIRPLVNWNGKIDTDSFPTQDKRERFPCLALWTSISIDRKGNIYPCCEAFSSRENSDLLFGNIYEGSLADIYDVQCYGVRTKHQNGRWNEISTCSKCDMWKESPDVFLKLGSRWW